MSAGARYDRIGTTYARHRRPDPRIVVAIDAALGAAATVLDVGSGTGSYGLAGADAGPDSAIADAGPDRRIVAVEPSRTMIAQRPPAAAPVVQAVAEHLPFPDDRFDAALAVLTHHHWTDAAAGFAELARVADRQVVLTWDPAGIAAYWFVAEFLPELAEAERGLATLDAALDALAVEEVVAVPVPADCVDGFCGAYWRRPEAYLDASVRHAISGIATAPPAAVDRAVDRLAADLADGSWHRRHADLLDRDELDLGYRIVVAGGRR